MPRRRTSSGSWSSAFGYLLLMPVHAVISGFVVRYMYHRIFAPTFPDLPQHLGVVEALGLAFFVGYLTMDEASAANDEREFGEREATFLMVRAFAVLSALVIGWFMP